MPTRRQRKRVSTASAPPGSVRIIAGKWRRRRLKIVEAAGLRPTPDRVRETLFAWLDSRLPGSRCLDLFAGTGALGFEAASRGAARVVLVELDPDAAAMLRRQREKFEASEIEVVQTDALSWLDSAGEAFDVIFLDPPFSGFDLGQLCARIDSNGLLGAGGVVYLEIGADAPEPVLPGNWRVSRSQRAGQVRYHLVSPDDTAQP